MLVATEPFDPVCRAVATSAGRDDHRWATIEHPIGSRSVEELDALARRAVEQIHDIVTGSTCADGAGST